MKLEKREITLNEEDSLKDMFYMEKTLLRAYEEGIYYAERKETEIVLSEKIEETRTALAELEKERELAASVKRM